ncbi:MULTISPECIES: DMT family transporter [unclassified Streptomyces]|uniref:DMT family transporter n=1 Tax=unclassified Streptomyces TaxID=2593676 RepID=UPI002DDA675A|nr:MULTISPECIES: DMT family transporter [unclassified Streptomyces]WSA75851.1 DMT family transporter [Streptomyces sp. NBC_01799]WSF87722.1 DMT family transporter [Streptomyces sp. NBC_01744]WSA67233.1 DMT family transporter [Streptomyces sp. NBC_01800]WSC36040.1 DMT family transporter [Streptomyces sp. NBC_01763]WSC44172.1 DMT family transporter [Streptomyces sp. NBC_01762]
MSVLVLVLAVSAACCLGFGFVLQQAAARHAPRRDYLSPRLLLDLMQVRSWLAGVGLMVSGMALGALALGKGEVSVVEPLLATNLLFAMALSRHRTGQRLGRQGWAGLWLLAGGVTAFLLGGRPQGGETITNALRHWMVVGVVVGIALLLTTFAKRSQHGAAPALLAVAAGLLYGLQDALTRMSGEVLSDAGWTALVTSWQPYAVVVLGVTGLILVQSAFETAPLRMSLPALTAAQPLAGIACGIGFLGDQVRTDAGALAWQAAGLVAIVVGIVLLGLHPAMPTGHDHHRRKRSLQPH